VHLGIVAFPNLAVGDQTVVRYVIHRRTPLFAGQFDDLVIVPFWRVGSFQVIVDMPPGMPLHADAAGFVAVPGTHPPGRTRYGWRYVGGDDARIEAGAVSAVDAGRRLAVSTFAGYPAFAAAFRQVMAGKALATPAVAALARQVASSLPDAQARALALTGWVRSNVRLSGSDGLGPHDAADVLAKRHGDDKDVAVLLEAMLAAVGIDSTPALVNHGNAYRLPDAPTLGVFNHMITYVPGLDLYLDPTFDAPDPAALPAAILGKPALLLETGTFAMTPLLQPRRTVTAATVDIDAGRLPSRVAAGGNSGRSAVVEAIRDMTLEPERRQDYVCPAVDAEDATRLRLPPGARILALPRSVQLMDGGIFYSARYVREGGSQDNAVLVRRRLTFRHGRPTCSPADYRAMRPLLNRIAR
jgi:transglutaminase-like putative cysteine protease